MKVDLYFYQMIITLCTKIKSEICIFKKLIPVWIWIEKITLFVEHSCIANKYQIKIELNL